MTNTTFIIIILIEYPVLTNDENHIRYKVDTFLSGTELFMNFTLALHSNEFRKVVKAFLI